VIDHSYLFGPCSACGALFYSMCAGEMILTGCCDACSHPVITVFTHDPVPGEAGTDESAR